MSFVNAAASKLLDDAAEAARLEALSDLHIMDSLPEQVFDDLTWLAAQLCDAPISLVSLVDGHRQWFKSRHGLEATETPRDAAFCAHTLGGDEVLEVEDVLLDARFADNPLVTGGPRIRFYAGAPLIGRGGQRFGALCVIDQKPRKLGTEQREGLVRLARRVSHAMEARRQQIISQAREGAMSRLLEALPDGVVTCDGNGRLKEFNRTARLWHGIDVREVPSEEWAQHFDLYEADGLHHLTTPAIPLARAWKGEVVREARIVIRAKGQPARHVSCNADPLLGEDGRLLGAVCVMHDVTQLMAAQEDALVETQRFAGAFGAASQGMALVSIEGRWLEVNDALCVMFGHSRDELQALDFQQLTHPDDLDKDLSLLAELLAGRRAAYQMDKRYFHRTGRIIHAHLSVSLVRDAKGAPLHFVSQVQDLTQRHQTEQRLRESEQHLRTVADNVPALIGHVGADLRYTFVNQAYADWFGRTARDIVGRHMSEVLRPEHFEGVRPRLDQVLAGQAVSFEMDVVARDGEPRHMHASYIPDKQGEAGAADAPHRGFHLMVHDVTPQTRLTRVLHERAMTDELTGLPNRSAWAEELERGVARARRSQASVAVMFLDLDGFKQVNDSHGHATGDAVLREFADRLRASLRKSDFIARLSGDEFVVFLDRVSKPRRELAAIADKVLQALEPAMRVNGHLLQLRASIGFAVQDGPDFDIALLMRHADEAMYEAKRDQSARYAVR